MLTLVPRNLIYGYLDLWVPDSDYRDNPDSPVACLDFRRIPEHPLHPDTGPPEALEIIGAHRAHIDIDMKIDIPGPPKWPK